MAKQKNHKITKEQLEELQSHVSKINQTQMQLGQAVSTKFDIIAMLPNLKKELHQFQAQLEKEYGKVNVNINDGTYQDVLEQVQ